MAYLANNHKGNNNGQNNAGQRMNNNQNYAQTSPRKKPFSSNGFKSSNNFKNNVNNPNQDQSELGAKIKQLKEKQKKENAKKAITTAANSFGPVAGAAAQAAVNTPKGEKYLDAYAKADTEAEGIRNVKKEIKKDQRKMTIALFFFGFCLPILFIILLASLFFKNADSQIFSNQNGGTVQSENYIGDDKVVNVFANYPGLYEKIMDTVSKMSDKYQIDVDKYLIIATLVAPIANDLIIPVDDHSCGEDECYYFKGESKTWSEFLSSWADQTELLAKMQMLTYTNNQNEIHVNCGPEETMEQYAQNDEETNTFPWWGWLNPVNWFKGFKDAAAAEVNAKCVDANNGESEVPTVRVLSIEQGEYYLTNNANKEYEFVKDPNSGGVYFWNLVNKNGFIHEYLKDYLSDEYSDDPDKNYEINKEKIVEITNYIYAYYDSIKKDCNGRQVIQGGLDKIDFREDGSSPIYTLDFEDIFVGGSVLATYGGARGEVAYAQAIITRSEAYNYIVEGGGKVITGSAKMGCWWWKWNPTYDPSYENQEDNPNYDPDYPKVHFPEIYEAVTKTRGIVVTKYGATKVEETEYDAFCPTTRDPIGNFYYLPDGQRDLPIELSRFSVPSGRTDCPCFQNESSRPKVEYEQTLNILTKKQIGTPAQDTLEKCWTPTGDTKVVKEEDDNGFETTKVLNGYKYDTTGGHGRGVSQHGMAYFSQFGYDYEALLKLFLERDSYGISLKKLEDTIEDGECPNYELYQKNQPSGTGSGSGSYNNSDGNNIGDSNYSSVIGGTAFNETLVSALSKTGSTIDDLNDCIKSRVEAAGPGTRAGVVEAGMGLLECTIDMTGGYTYPYDHYGGNYTQADLNGKLGVNSKWGEMGGTGCQGAACRLGLNCATFVRWSMCNGGMDLCDRGSTYAQEIASTQFFPEAVKIKMCPGFQVQAGSTSISSSSEAFDAIQPGDVLFSNTVNGGNGHVMLVVGKSGDIVTIAENGRKTRQLNRSELTGGNTVMTYSILLLDDYYANTGNRNSLY